MRTSLHDKLSAAAVMGPYCGAQTALSFGDPRAEFFALREGCGIYDLGWRARFRISGKDSTRWLNGMVTNNIRDLQPGHGTYNFVLNPQGRIQGDLYVYRLGDEYLAGTEREQAERLIPLLQRYIIMDKVELKPLDDEFTAIGVQGPEARKVMQQAGFAEDVRPMQITKTSWNDVPTLLTRMADEKYLSYEIWCPPEYAGRIWDALVAAGAKPVGMQALEMFRVAAGIPRYGQDIHDRDLPQETEQHQALNFTKGCYIGQEIVERIRSRGAVHRTFTGFVVEGDAPQPGTKIHADGKEVGEITSALRVPSKDGDKTLALGSLRREVAKPGSLVQVGGTSATVSSLPFVEAVL